MSDAADAFFAIFGMTRVDTSRLLVCGVHFPCEHVVSRCGDPTRDRPWQDLPGMRRLMPGVYHAWGDGRRPRCDAVRCAVVRLKDCEVTR